MFLYLTIATKPVVSISSTHEDPYPGNKVIINCTSSTNSYTIIDPTGERIINQSLIINSFNSSSQGNYTCTSTNMCGNITEVMRLLRNSKFQS